jgi:restriction system protein
MSNGWLLRPSPHGISRMSEFLANNIIGIGWPGIGDLSGKTREQIKSILSQPPYRLTSLELGNAYATVDIFVNRMNVDNLVLVPDGDDIHFGIIKSNYFFDTKYDSDAVGYSHQRRVEWLSSTLRKNLPMDLRKSLKVHRATADLSGYYEVIKTLAYGADLSQTNSFNNENAIVSVDYPLRPEVLVTVTVPRDITRTESERLGDFIKTLYFE